MNNTIVFVQYLSRWVVTVDSTGACANSTDVCFGARREAVGGQFAVAKPLTSASELTALLGDLGAAHQRRWHEATAQMLAGCALHTESEHEQRARGVRIADRAVASAMRVTPGWYAKARIESTSAALIAGTADTPLTSPPTRHFLLSVKVAFDPRAARAGYARLGRAQSSLNAEDSDRLGISAAAEAVKYAGASELAATRVAVLLEQGAAVGLVHEVFGHLLEAGVRPAYLSGRGRLCRVPLRVVDDPGLVSRFGSYQIDDEGVRRSRTVLVEHGAVQDTLASRASAGRSSTGNGRRESWRHRALTRMSNVVVSCPGGDDATIWEAFDDLGTHTKTLRLVTLRGGAVTLSNGRFRLHTGTATLHGREPQWVRDVTIEGSAVDVLGKLVAVGRTPSVEQSLCGKGGQRIPVSGQAPAMLVRDMHAWSGAPLPKSHRGGPEGAP
jgi:hypothetical protein